jgi:hypothetical protein
MDQLGRSAKEEARELAPLDIRIELGLDAMVGKGFVHARSQLWRRIDLLQAQKSALLRRSAPLSFQTHLVI